MELDKFEETCDAIVKLVSEYTDTRWELNALVDSACERTGLKYKPNIQMAVKAMLRCGFLKGYKGTRNYEAIRLSPNGSDAASTALQEKLKDLAGQLQIAQDKQAASEKAAQKAKDEADRRSSILEIIMDHANGKKVSHKGVFHHKFPEIVELAKRRKNIFIYGPTGLGKSHICKQLAEVLGLDFAFIQCTSGMSEGQVTGRLLPVGANGTFQYVISEAPAVESKPPARKVKPVKVKPYKAPKRQTQDERPLRGRTPRAERPVEHLTTFTKGETMSDGLTIEPGNRGMLRHVSYSQRFKLIGGKHVLRVVQEINARRVPGTTKMEVKVTGEDKRVPDFWLDWDTVVEVLKRTPYQQVQEST